MMHYMTVSRVLQEWLLLRFTAAPEHISPDERTWCTLNPKNAPNIAQKIAQQNLAAHRVKKIFAYSPDLDKFKDTYDRRLIS